MVTPHQGRLSFQLNTRPVSNSQNLTLEEIEAVVKVIEQEKAEADEKKKSRLAATNASREAMMAAPEADADAGAGQV